MPASQLQSIVTNIKVFYQSNPWKGRAITTILVLVLALIIARIALSPVIIYNATSWLKQQDIDATIEDIDINLFDGSVSLLNAQGRRDDKPLFNIGLVEIHWQWTPLSSKTVAVTRVALDDLHINIEKYSDELIISGVSLALNETTLEEASTEEDKEDSQWAASLGEVVFSNLDICYLQHHSSKENIAEDNKAMDYCVALQEMIWSGNIEYATTKDLPASGGAPVSSTGDFTLSGLTITDNRLNKYLLASEENHLNDVTISGLHDIRIRQLEMNGLSALQRDDDKHIDAIRFKQLTINDIHLKSMDSLSIDNILLDHPGLYLVKDNSSHWEYQQWLPATKPAKPAKEKTAIATSATQNTEVDTFDVSISSVIIEKPDTCYRQKETPLYYCFTADRFSLTGKLNYNTGPSLSGDLVLSSPVIRNHGLQRNLLSLDALELSGLRITDVNRIDIDDIQLNKLNAMQRGEKPDDSTLAFNKLAITDLRYSPDTIGVNTITLTELAGNISINKNGKFEHDKWLPDDSTKNDQANNTKQAAKKPVAIALNSLDITSGKPFLFTDNSTSPTMKIGLQSVALNISKLDSKKPDDNSSFKLAAKTTRHSTIDIAGTAKPFADKISFDGKGKLKGFDLRAGSPAAKKAIGHIIQSGQMDADLKLLAKEGILDSNIALSLYHFNIKPESKQDADKFDKKFGMPLNQTLVLLRDKDDSIHLDIPITGDVNNPDFNPMDAIIKATSKAATVTLITFYTPYGLVYAGGNVLFDLATAMDFDPVEFSPGSSTLNGSNKEKLDKLASLMTEKPQIHLTLCGKTNNDDLYTLNPELKEKSDKKELKLSARQTSTLQKLAQERQINTKNYLVKEAGISHDRLILCAPEHQTEDDAIAGVEINI